VGKTTNCVNIAAGLGSMGKRVLLIDTDAEASATRHLGIEPEAQGGIYELLLHQNSVQELRITEGMPKNVDLIPSRPFLNNIRSVLTPHHNIFTRFVKPLVEVQDQYDFVLIDTPPAADAIQTIAAYAVAHWLVLSVLPEPFSVDGMLTALRRTVKVVQEETNEELDVLGVLISGVDHRSKLWKEEVVEPLTKLGAGYLIFKHLIRRNNLVPRCQKKGISVFQYRGSDQKDKKPLLDDYRGVIDEMLYRMGHTAEFLGGDLQNYESGIPDVGQVVVKRQEESAPLVANAV
jgi:chromosome partitioning protein